MPSQKSLPHWLSFDRIKPALLTGVILFVFSYIVDLVPDWLHLPAKATMFENMAIALVGAVLLLFYLSASYEAQVYARAKERMILVEELNHHIRQALILVEESAMLEDRAERIRYVDEAVGKIDVVLMDLVPTAGSATALRYSLPVHSHS